MEPIRERYAHVLSALELYEAEAEPTGERWQAVKEALGLFGRDQVAVKYASAQTRVVELGAKAIRDDRTLSEADWKKLGAAVQEWKDARTLLALFQDVAPE